MQLFTARAAMSIPRCRYASKCISRCIGNTHFFFFFFFRERDCHFNIYDFDISIFQLIGRGIFSKVARLREKNYYQRHFYSHLRGWFRVFSFLFFFYPSFSVSFFFSKFCKLAKYRFQNIRWNLPCRTKKKKKKNWTLLTIRSKFFSVESVKTETVKNERSVGHRG